MRFFEQEQTERTEKSWNLPEMVGGREINRETRGIRGKGLGGWQKWRWAMKLKHEKVITTDFTDFTDGEPGASYPCNPCNPWLNFFACHCLSGKGLELRRDGGVL